MLYFITCLNVVNHQRNFKTGGKKLFLFIYANKVTCLWWVGPISKEQPDHIVANVLPLLFKKQKWNRNSTEFNFCIFQVWKEWMENSNKNGFETFLSSLCPFLFPYFSFTYVCFSFFLVSLVPSFIDFFTSSCLAITLSYLPPFCSFFLASYHVFMTHILRVAIRSADRSPRSLGAKNTFLRPRLAVTVEIRC